jgi:hypothetical protein
MKQANPALNKPILKMRKKAVPINATTLKIK